eukprot:247139_1
MESLPNPYPISLQESDKFGCLVQIRQAMDSINSTEFASSTESLIHILKPDQLKTVLFVGLNYIRHQLTYDQLFKMKGTYKAIIDSKKDKHKNKIPCEDEASNIIPTPIPTNVTDPLPKGASLSKTIPIDIITIHICSFLDLLSIYQFSKCDRNVAIITHTPSAIRTLQFNYLDRYPYAVTYKALCLDAKHLSQHQDVHLIRNVTKLSIIRSELGTGTITALCNKLQHINHIKHLTIYQEFRGCLENCECDTLCNEYTLSEWDFIFDDWPLMKSLESIRFDSTFELPLLLSILHQYNVEPIDESAHSYHESMYNLKCISFLRCHLYSLSTYESELSYEDDDEDDHFEPDLSHYFDEYETMLELLLPSRRNSIEELKFEESIFEMTSETDDHETVNEAFSDLDRVSSSLSCLKGIVYSDCQASHLPDGYECKQDVFYNITHTILQNISYFQQLASAHVHTEDTLLPLLFLNNPVEIFSQIKGICVTISLSASGLQLINKLKDLANNKSFNIEKICLVLDVPSTINKRQNELLIAMIEKVLCHCEYLELFQIVCKIQNENMECRNKECKDCKSKFDVVYHIFKQLNKHLMSISVNEYTLVEYAKKRLISRFHIKSSHYSHTECSAFSPDSLLHDDKLTNLLRTLSLTYLTVFPTGKLVYKFSWNSKSACTYYSVFKNLLPLKGIFDVQHAKCALNKQFASSERYRINIHDNRDHAKECISLQCKSDANSIQEQNNAQWVTDCMYCDNKPWL